MRGNHTEWATVLPRPLLALRDRVNLSATKEENELIKLHPFPSKYRDFFFLGSNCFFKGIFLGTHLESYLFLLHDKRSSCPPILLLPHIIIYLIPPPRIVRIDRWTVVRKVLGNGREKNLI